MFKLKSTTIRVKDKYFTVVLNVSGINDHQYKWWYAILKRLAWFLTSACIFCNLFQFIVTFYRLKKLNKTNFFVHNITKQNDYNNDSL